jgi:hypothetical protein
MARKTRNCKKRGGRRGMGINARTVRVQRHLENIQRDISTAITELGQLSANIQQHVQELEHRNQNRNRNAPEPGVRNHQNRNALEPGHRNRVLNNENRNAPGRLPNNRNAYPNDGYARDWVFQGVRYARMGNDIWEIDQNNWIGSWVGVYLPAENRINRNALEPEYENE